MDPSRFLADLDGEAVPSQTGRPAGRPRQRHLRLVAAQTIPRVAQPGADQVPQPLAALRSVGASVPPAAPVSPGSSGSAPAGDLRSSLRSSGATARRSRVVARRRLVLASAVLGASLIGINMAGASGRSPAVGQTPSARTYLVQPGDSLWSIARALQPQGDVRVLVHQLEQANGVVNLQAGSTLRLP